MKVSFLILAKKESKRLKNKNWRDFCGKPMFVWNVLKCKELGDVYVSSESDMILKIAKKYGAMPIKRPKELCGDIPNIPVYRHAIRFMGNTDTLIAVQANSPTIDKYLIEAAKEIMLSGFCRELMTCHNDFKLYGSIWAMSKKRLESYGDPCKQTPEILLVDESVDVHIYQDFLNAKKQWTQA